jgi:transposase-like protein
VQALVIDSTRSGASMDRTGPDGLLKTADKTGARRTLSDEMTEHLGHEKYGLPGAGTDNIRNGSTWAPPLPSLPTTTLNPKH